MRWFNGAQLNQKETNLIADYLASVNPPTKQKEWELIGIIGMVTLGFLLLAVRRFKHHYKNNHMDKNYEDNR